MNKNYSKCLTMCSNCHWDYESRKDYSITCLNCERKYCDSCNDCGSKCKKNNKNILLVPSDPELNFVLKYGYGYNVEFDFSECVLCTKIEENMKIRIKDKYELLLKMYELIDSEVADCVRICRSNS